jgi:vitamin B12/bleomycin/antimicrobial peptide transport system ATP-binding/permease protein
LENLTLTLPNGQKLLENANLSLNPGETVLLTGASGAGKSTLFRAIAGIWPFGSGHVSRPEGTALFLPQRPYFPLGSLKRAITYPNNEADFTEEMVTGALEAVGLEKLADRLNEVENWSQILSGGEQQRLALTRALITKPDWLFLDEATSALDEPLAARVQTVLKERLPNTTIVSITHRESLASNQRHLALAGGNLAPVKYGQGLVTP